MEQLVDLVIYDADGVRIGCDPLYPVTIAQEAVVRWMALGYTVVVVPVEGALTV